MVHRSAIILSALALGVAPSLCASVPRGFIRRRDVLPRAQGSPSLGSVSGTPLPAVRRDIGDESQVFARAQGPFPLSQSPPNPSGGSLTSRDVGDLFARAQAPPSAATPPEAAPPLTPRDNEDEFMLEARDNRHQLNVDKFNVRKAEHQFDVDKYHHKRDDESQLFARNRLLFGRDVELDWA